MAGSGILATGDNVYVSRDASGQESEKCAVNPEMWSRAVWGLAFCCLGLAAGCASMPRNESVAEGAPEEFRATFLKFCDLAAAELCKPMEPFRVYDRSYAETATHHMPAFEDAHAVRALAVAFDLTGEPKYLEACRRWADWAVEHQARMIPPGAYYMNHSRAPGEDRGQWNAADSGTVGMGVLAAALRCPDAAGRERYLASVRAFLKLMMDWWVDESGGICNGLWPEYTGPWWCSTATVGKLALLMHKATGDAQYQRVGLRGIEWLSREHFKEVKPITFEQRPSGIIFYCFDFYITGLDRFPADSPVREAVCRQFEDAAAWLAQNQKTRGAAVPDYTRKNVDMAAMPSLMYAFARKWPERFGGLVEPADAELRYVADLLLREGEPQVSQLMIWEVMTWGMMSYAERLAPGSITEGRIARVAHQVRMN